MKKISALALSFIFGLAAALTILTAYIPHAGAAEISVPSNHSTIQGAINAAANGDVIIVEQGTYVENINFSGKAIIIRSANPNDPNVVATTIIDGGKSGSVVTFDTGEGNDSILQGITVRNGQADNGGGIYCNVSSPTISNCLINGNATNPPAQPPPPRERPPGPQPPPPPPEPDTGFGGGIFCKQSTPTITNCTIVNNSTAIIHTEYYQLYHCSQFHF